MLSDNSFIKATIYFTASCGLRASYKSIERMDESTYLLERVLRKMAAM